MEKALLGYNPAPNTISELENITRGCLGGLDHCLPSSFIQLYGLPLLRLRIILFSVWSPHWGYWQKERTVWTAMVSVKNWTSNINDHAMKIRWTSLKTNSRHKEQNRSECWAREVNMCPDRGRHPNPQSCSCRAHFHLCALTILALRCRSLLCLKNLKLSRETSPIIFHW